MESIFAYMKENDANYKYMYELSVWADDVKTAGMHLFDNWHFFDQIFLDGISEKDCKIIVNKNNCVAHTVISSNTIMEKATGQEFLRAKMLRYLIHLVGDMHQPLHEISRCTPGLPHGDAGGNAFKLDYKFTSLHWLWDEAMGTQIPQIKRVLCHFNKQIHSLLMTKKCMKLNSGQPV
jgi:hypothetical protein